VRGRVACCAILTCVLTAATAVRAETLADAIALAYRTSPVLQGQRAQLRALDETYVQAEAGYRPSVNVTANATRDDIGGLVQSDSDYSLTLTQPLYTGGRVSAEVNAARGDILSARESLRQTEAGVLENVIRAYADVRRDQQAFAIREKNLEDLTTQVRDNQTRFEAGDVTRTDVAQSQAGQAEAQALLAQAQAQLEISRATYGSVVGQPPGSLDPEPDLPRLPINLDQAVLLAAQDDSAVRGAKYDEKASRERVVEAKAGGAPQVNLQASYGYANNRSNYVPNIYGQQVVVGASFTQPLFAGGAIQSRVRQAHERNLSDKQKVEQAERDSALRVSKAWSQLTAARIVITASQAGVQAATVAYEGTEAERKAGLRTTLEVLVAQQTERDAELNLVAARHDVYLAQADVLSAVGQLEARFLIPSTPLYDPAKAFGRVRGDGFVPWEPLVGTLDGLTVPRLKPLSALAGLAPTQPAVKPGVAP
jgi:outer membrane protein